MSKGSKKYSGFSLFEVIITMGILLLIAILVFPITISKTQRSKLESYATQATTDIYYQQQRSSLKGIDTGVAIQSDGYTLFDGVELLTATETQSKSLPSNVSITNISLTSGTEITFTGGSFKPAIYGTFLITNSTDTIRVYINREGLIGYEIL
ncbi:MAG: prepilin-type N-terminal cleavage/methylation domain-containing protein [Candidatus Dojkabacteria bacterium]|jgi:type II secretory pathway pseudopilin PulG|nr:prepilin-type N-terminal cleavage/methylation domain-containing protein [Candidatus Dojkabacteria bacterium]